MCVCCDVSALIINYCTNGKDLAAEALFPQLFTLRLRVSLMAEAGHAPRKQGGTVPKENNFIKK